MTGPESNGAGGPPFMAYVYRDRDGGTDSAKWNLPARDPDSGLKIPMAKAG